MIHKDMAELCSRYSVGLSLYIFSIIISCHEIFKMWTNLRLYYTCSVPRRFVFIGKHWENWGRTALSLNDWIKFLHTEYRKRNLGQQI